MNINQARKLTKNDRYPIGVPEMEELAKAKGFIEAWEQQAQIIRRLAGALRAINYNLPFGIEEAYEITIHHLSSGSGTMGPNLTGKFSRAVKNMKALLSTLPKDLTDSEEET